MFCRHQWAALCFRAEPVDEEEGQKKNFLWEQKWWAGSCYYSQSPQGSQIMNFYAFISFFSFCCPVDSCKDLQGKASLKPSGVDRWLQNIFPQGNSLKWTLSLNGVIVEKYPNRESRKCPLMQLWAKIYWFWFCKSLHKYYLTEWVTKYI